MSSFKRVLREGIKAENWLTRFRASKAHSTLSSSTKESSQLKKSTGTSTRLVNTMTPKHVADRFGGKFRDDIDVKNLEGFRELDRAITTFVATFDKVDRELSEFMAARFKAAEKRMFFFGIGTVAYCAAICFALACNQGSSKEVDGPSPEQVRMYGNPVSACGSG